MGLSRVSLGLQKTLRLGNLDAKRDWGYSKDYVEAIWKILQHKEPDDFLIATGETHSVREWVEEVGKHLGMSIEWKGKGLLEKIKTFFLIPYSILQSFCGITTFSY